MDSMRRLNFLFETSLYLILLIPFGMLLIGDSVSLPMGIVFGVVGLASWFLRGGALADPKNQKWWNLGIMGYVAYTMFQIFFSDEAILQTGINLVLVLVLIKLLSRAGGRDELQLFLLSFIMLAAATTVNEDVLFGVLFSFYVLLGTFSMAVFHLREELSGHPRLALRNQNPLNRQYIGVLAGISSIILVLSVGIFFTFPRVGLGFFQPQSRSADSMVGFSESVELGGHGVIRSNPEVVLRVEFADGVPREDPFYWRMMSFDEYDGIRWNRTLPSKSWPLPRGKNRVRPMHSVFPVEDPTLEMQMYLEPLDTTVLPTLWPTKGIRLGAGLIRAPGAKFEFTTPRHGRLAIDPYGDIHHNSHSQLGIPYSLWRGTPGDEPTRVVRAGDHYLQLPDSFTPRARAKAREVAGEGVTLARVERLNKWFRDEFQYTTDLPKVGSNPVESFLFDTRRGHCEYFATSMVLMLRANGIKARLVNGFLGGKWNAVGGYLAVRQGDAHSWVEWYDPARGWVPTDPTPPTESWSDGSIGESLRQYYDAAQLSWTKWVIEYDLASQVDFFRKASTVFRPDGLLKGAAEGRAEQESDEEAFTLEWRFVYILSLFVFGLLSFWRTRRRVNRGARWGLVAFTATSWMTTSAVVSMFLDGWNPTTAFVGAGVAGAGALAAIMMRGRTNGAMLATSAFAKVERAGAARGIHRADDEGPKEYLKRLEREIPQATSQLQEFSRIYLKARFSPRAPVASEITALNAAAKAAVRALRR